MTSADPRHDVQVIRQRLKALEEQLQRASHAPVNRIAEHLGEVMTELEDDLARQREPSVQQAIAPSAQAPVIAEASPKVSVSQSAQSVFSGLWLAAAALIVGLLAFPAGHDESRQAAPTGASGVQLAMPAQPPWPAGALHTLRHLKIQSNGRTESMDDFSRQVLTFVAGTSKLGAQDPVQTVFFIIADPLRWREAPIILVESPAVRNRLRLDRRRLRASWAQLMGDDRLTRRVLAVARKQARGGRLTPEEREMMIVSARALMLEDLFEQHLYLVSPAFGSAQAWTPILDPDDYPPEQQIGVKRSWAMLLAAVRDGDPADLTDASWGLRRLLYNLGQPPGQFTYRPPQPMLMMRD